MDIFGELELAQAQGLEGNLRDPGGVNLSNASSKSRNKNIEAQRQIQERALAQQAQRRGPFATGNQMYNPGMVANVAGAMTGAQGNAHQNMINQATNAWRDEHDSRVSQNREARRMQHEKDIERMRIEALLKRLEMEKDQGPRPLASGRGFTIR